MGVLAGSVTLTGGPATGLAFAPLFEAGRRARRGDARRGRGHGRHRRRRRDGRTDRHLPRRTARCAAPCPGRRAQRHAREPGRGAGRRRRRRRRPAGEDVESYVLMKHLVVMIVAVGVGVWVSRLADAPRHDAARLHRRDARRRRLPQPRRFHRRVRAVAAGHRRHRQHRAVVVPGDGVDDAAVVGTGGPGDSAAGDPGGAGRADRGGLRVRRAAR